MNVLVFLGDVAALLRVVFGLIVAFGVLPMVVLPRPRAARNGLDAYVMNLLRWVAIVIVGTHVLTLIGIYSPPSVAIALLVLAWFARYRRQLGGIPGLLARLWPAAVPRPTPAPARRARVGGRRVLPAVGFVLPPLVVLFGSYVLRVSGHFRIPTLTPPDAYIHMTWAQQLRLNDLWPDGVYPMGFPSVIAFVDLFAPVSDLVDVARFTGAAVGTLIVFAIYYAVVRLTRNAGAALFAAGAFGLFGAAWEWRIPWERASGLLPQEFGLALALLTVPLVVLAVTEDDGGGTLRVGPLRLRVGGYALSAAAGGLAAAMCHPLPAAWLGLLCVVAATCAVMLTRRFREYLGVGTAVVGGTVAGLAVVPAAELLGVPVYVGYGATQVIADVTGAGSQAREVFSDSTYWLVHNRLSVLAGVLAVTGLVAGLALVLRAGQTVRGAQLTGLAAAALVPVALFDIRPLLDALSTMFVFRLAQLVGPSLALGLGVGVAVVSTTLLRGAGPARVGKWLVAGTLALALFAFPFRQALPDAVTWEGETVEWAETAHLIRHLKRTFDPGAYTVAGTTPQRQLLTMRSHFVELWVFARDAHDVPPEEVLPIPTYDTFVFVELDVHPIVEIEPLGAVEEYYFDRDKRGRIMAATYAWAEERRAVNPDTTIYYEGEHLRVYRVSRNPAIRFMDHELVLFQDYHYTKGALFNDGPTSPRELQARFEPDAVAAATREREEGGARVVLPRAVP